MDHLASFINYLNNKASTTLFAIYAGFWATVHSDGIVALLFVDQDKIYEKYGLLKNEYLFDTFFGFHPDNILWWVRLILPFVFTALYVLFFAKFVLNPAYKIEIKYKYARKLEKYKKETDLQKEKDKLDRVKVRSAQNQTKIKEEQIKQEELDPEVKWAKDYERFSGNLYSREAINALEDLYYSHSGYLTDGRGNLNIDRDYLSLCESYGLFRRDEKSRNYIDITDKGWYFIREMKSGK